MILLLNVCKNNKANVKPLTKYIVNDQMVTLFYRTFTTRRKNHRGKNEFDVCFLHTTDDFDCKIEVSDVNSGIEISRYCGESTTVSFYKTEKTSVFDIEVDVEVKQEWTKIQTSNESNSFLLSLSVESALYIAKEMMNFEEQNSSVVSTEELFSDSMWIDLKRLVRLGVISNATRLIDASRIRRDDLRSALQDAFYSLQEEVEEMREEEMTEEFIKKSSPYMLLKHFSDEGGVEEEFIDKFFNKDIAAINDVVAMLNISYYFAKSLTEAPRKRRC